MHELSIAEALIEQVQRELHRAGQQGPVKCLELTVGRLSGVHSPSLRFAFDLISPGTVVEGAKLEIAEAAAVCQCRGCGARQTIEDLVAACPQCGSPEITIAEGRDLLLRGIELEESA